MSSFLNFVIRKDGAVRTSLASKQILDHIFDPGLYYAGEEALDKLRWCFVDAAEHPGPGAGKVAPYDSGLVVFDFDQRLVLDMQGYAPCNMFPTTLLPSPGRAHLGELMDRKWLGEGLYDMLNGELVEPFPEEPFPDVASLEKWALRVYGRALVSIEGGQVRTHPTGPILVYKLTPADWRHKTFRDEQAEKFVAALEASGFHLSQDDSQQWRDWAEQKRA